MIVPSGGPIGDPFLDTVHARRPDVQILVLPGAAADAAEVRSAAEIAELPAALADELRRMWPDVVTGVAVPAIPEGVWAATSATSVRCRVEIRVEGIDIDHGATAPGRAAVALNRAGWHGLAPVEGMPRIEARHADPIADRGFLLVYIAESSTLLIRHEAGPIEVDRFSQRQLVPTETS